jgi:hypothetical protein
VAVRGKKKKAKSLRQLKDQAWKLLSQYVRRRHADEGGTVSCYTCGKLLHWKYEAQAGHAIHGRTGAVLLDVEIIRPQCDRCNRPISRFGGRGGNYEVFAAKLIRENGLEWFERKLQGAREVVKLTRSDLEEFIQNYKQKLEELPT